MVRGWFEPRTGRPFVNARLVLARLGVAGELRMLVDTGADASLLAFRDCSRLGVDFTMLRGLASGTSMSGTTQAYSEAADVSFEDLDGIAYTYRIDIDIALPSPATLNVPSLLGRDILDRWVMTYAPTRGELSFDVVSADRTLA